MILCVFPLCTTRTVVKRKEKKEGNLGYCLLLWSAKFALALPLTFGFADRWSKCLTFCGPICCFRVVLIFISLSLSSLPDLTRKLTQKNFVLAKKKLELTSRKLFWGAEETRSDQKNRSRLIIGADFTAIDENEAGIRVETSDNSESGY